MRTVDGFRLLEISPQDYRRRRISFAVGCAAEVLAIGLLALAGVWFPQQIEQQINRYVVIRFPSLDEEEPLLKPPPPPKVVARTIEPPVPVEPAIVPPPRPEVPKIQEREIPLKPPTLVSPPPQPVATAMARPLPPPPPTVQTGLFHQAEEHPKGERIPLKDVQTGGFGDPQGLPGRAEGGNPGNVPRLGAFYLPGGPGKGNGLGGARGSARVVASAGFGAGGVGVSRGPGGGAPAAVKTGLFAARESAQAPAKPLHTAPAAPEVSPVEVLFKPSPRYTEEARRLRVEGEVVLSVVFQADGTLKVVGVVKSLGHGLDEMAEQAASQIRFKPAEEGGKPKDFPATLRIEFRLA
jgi:TonB family protein